MSERPSFSNHPISDIQQTCQLLLQYSLPETMADFDESRCNDGSYLAEWIGSQFDRVLVAAEFSWLYLRWLWWSSRYTARFELEVGALSILWESPKSETLVKRYHFDEAKDIEKKLQCALADFAGVVATLARMQIAIIGIQQQITGNTELADQRSHVLATLGEYVWDDATEGAGIHDARTVKIAISTAVDGASLLLDTAKAIASEFLNIGPPGSSGFEPK